MKILKMSLENFQGIKEFDLTTKGGDVSVYGDNGTGKSTLYNAFTWLMYGKSSTDEKNYTPKTVGSHHLNHVIEMTAELDDGSQVTYRKDFHEVYKTKKGNADPIFDGHTSEYSIDGVPVKESQFSEALKDLYKSEELAKMLTSYSYFLEDMKIKDRRAKLLEMCGDVSFEAVIDQNDDLKELPTILKKPGETDSVYTVEEYQAIAAKSKKLIDKKLKEIPGRIDEVEKAKPPKVSEDKAELELASRKLSMEKLELESAANASKNEVTAGIKAEIAEAKAAYEEARTKFMLEEADRNGVLLKELKEMRAGASAVEDEINSLIKKENERLENAKNMAECRERLMKMWKEENAKKWEGDGICPTCGQPLPEEQIEKAKEEFNIQKSKALEDIQKRGAVVSKDNIEAEKAEAAALSEKIEKKKTELLSLKSDIREKEGSYSTQVTFKDSEEGKALAGRIEELKKALEEAEKSAEGNVNKDVDKIAAIEEKITEINLKIAALAQTEKLDERLRELEAEEQELAEEFDEISKGLYLCDLYSKTKAEALDDKVNSHFKTLKFRLFIEQQNGGIADDCEALIPCGDSLVPFKSANNAARINAGLELIDALGDFYGVRLPIFVDNAESSTQIAGTGAQQIRLYVSEKDKVLRVENG